MKYFLRIVLSLILLVLVMIIPVMGNKWAVNHKAVPTVTSSEAINALPGDLHGLEGETFRNNDNTHAYRSYGKKGAFAVRIFGSEQEAYKALISTATDSRGTVQSRINGEILSQGKIRTIKKAGIEGFYSTSDTGRTGFFWLNGKILYSVEAQNRRDLDYLAGQYPYLKLKFDIFRIMNTAARRIGSWLIPLIVILSLFVFIYLILTGFLGLLSLTGSKKGDGPMVLSESELSAVLEALNDSLPITVEESGRYDFRIDKKITESEQMPLPLKTRSAFLTLDPLKKVVYMKEVNVTVTSGKKGLHYRINPSFFPVVPRFQNYKDSAGDSLASLLIPVVTKAGWRWRPETGIPTANAIINRMNKEG